LVAYFTPPFTVKKIRLIIYHKIGAKSSSKMRRQKLGKRIEDRGERDKDDRFARKRDEGGGGSARGVVSEGSRLHS